LEAIHCQKISWMNSWNGSGTQSDKNPEQWGSCVVANNASSCVGNKLLCICYFDFNGCWEYDKRLWHTYV
jgi:hypothetical protein